MAEFRKKPVIIEAWLNHPDNDEDKPEWLYNAIISGVVRQAVRNDQVVTLIKTLEGEMESCEGDYIIQGVQGEIYSCKASIFEQTYENLLSKYRVGVEK